MTFSEKLRTLIEEREITQKSVAAALQIPASTFGGYVQGTSEPDFATLKLLAAYFHVSAGYFLDIQENQIQTDAEQELLRVFRTLTPEQQILYLEQGKAFSKINAREPEKSSPSARNPGGRVG